MVFIASFFDFFKSIEAINYMFMGVRVGVIALILKAFLKMFSSCKKDAFFYVMFALAFFAVAILGAGTIPVIISAGLIGLCSVLVSLRRDKK